MKSRIAVALAVLALADTAGAQSFIPNNQIDDFGVGSPVRSAGNATATLAPGRSSPIPANQIDDFGPLSTGSPSTTVVRTAHCSPIPGNQIDDFTVTPLAQEEAATFAVQSTVQAANHR